jgi:hypothetical protein
LDILDSTNIPVGYCQCGCGQKTKLATMTVTKYGHIKGQPLKCIHGHKPRRTKPFYVEEDRGYVTACWIWQSTFTNYGYGRVTFKGKNQPAHRLFYEKRHGPVEPGLQLHHLCEVTACVNPDHIQPLTPAEHMRTRKNTKLSIADCKEMQQLYAEGGISYRILGERYGVAIMTAYKAVNGPSRNVKER